ncbi:MAG: methyltransferase domain-containing protein [Rhodospirillaceae bacterium]|nr:methyltransferase domain-containing protein [Rhodospirillaceae bacterium]
MSLRDAIFGQFKKPEGWLGRIAGWIMATRPSNRRRNLWTVELLRIEPGDRVLEIGCGPGLALKASAERATSGLVVGLDHSRIMLTQAWRRNRRAIEDRRVQLKLGGVEQLPMADRVFDKVFAVNVVQFLPDKEAALRAIGEVMAPGATGAITYQPRNRNPTRADTMRVGEEIKAAMAVAGFEMIRSEELFMRPAPVICVLARKAATGP